MKLQKNLDQKGLAHLLPIIAVVIILIIGFAAYRVVNKNKDEPAQNNTEKSQSVKTDDATEPQETVYNFENSPLQLDLLKGWKVNAEEHYDQMGDEFKESYAGTIDGPDGWSIDFALDQGGFGGGPGCNINNEFPDMPDCPHFKVISKKKLETGDYLYHYSQSKAGNSQTAGTEEESDVTNCVIVSDKGESANTKVGSTFEATGWVCHPYIKLKGATVKNGKPYEARLSINFPNGLEKDQSFTYENEVGFKQAMEILGSLRYR